MNIAAQALQLRVLHYAEHVYNNNDDNDNDDDDNNDNTNDDNNSNL